VTDVLVRLGGVARRFGPVAALVDADLELRSGEVHAVLGENGAGKSTLLGVLGGTLRPDAGSIEVNGRTVTLTSARDAWSLGIGLVHQHFMLVPALSVLENLALGRRSAAGGLRLPFDRIREEAASWMERTGLRVGLRDRVADLGVGDRQRVEILKALLRDPLVLALDEPTAVLTPGEVESLFRLIRELARAGKAVALVAHKVDEVLAVADRVTVLRGGRTTLTAPRAGVDSAQLVKAMVGPESADRLAVRVGEPPRPARPRGEEVASLSGVRMRGASGRVALEDASLAVHRGEIVGVAGVEGNGQRELALALAGRARPEAGTARIPAGVGFIPQDRTEEGLIGDFDLTENVGLALHRDPGLRRGPFLRWGAVAERAEQIRARFHVVAPDVGVPARSLSGGNQQRLVVGRELERGTDLIVAENPTRGLDVAATAFVRSELERLGRSASGPGVLLISTDLDEVLALADRVLVIARGRLLPVDESARTREGVGALMLGGTRDAG